MMLVLGASEDQLPVYLEARRRGIKTIAVDQRADRPALPHADEWLPVSTHDPDQIVAALDGRRPTAVVSAASDAALWTWHELSRRFDTPYHYPAAAARASVDKAAFHAVAHAAGAPGYRWQPGTDPAALTRAAQDIGLPVIVKPADSSGSKGVSLVEHPADLAGALAYAARSSPSGSLVVEEYVAGRNLTVDIFMAAGQAAFSCVTQKQIEPGPHFVIGGHMAPAPLDGVLSTRLVDLAERLCRAIELRDGPANFDVIVRDDGSVAVLEANARLCGNGVPRLLREISGADTIRALVSLALGEPFELRATRRDVGALRVLGSPLDRDAVVTAVRGVDQVRAMAGVVGCDVYVEPGQTVRPFVQSANKFGYVMVTGPDAATVATRLDDALTVLDIELEEIAS